MVVVQRGFWPLPEHDLEKWEPVFGKIMLKQESQACKLLA
jgi:hypothetical protein